MVDSTCSLCFLILGVCLLFGVHSSQAVCWDTGCQLDTWAVRGCAQYNMKETGERPCNGGIIYSCCDADPGPSSLGKYGDMTWYELGLTACGQVYSDQDMVAALAFGYFTTPNPNVDPICGRQVKIVDPESGRQVVVKVVDKCEGCTMSDVDLSPSAFQQVASLDRGRVKVNWDFI